MLQLGPSQKDLFPAIPRRPGSTVREGRAALSSAPASPSPTIFPRPFARKPLVRPSLSRPTKQRIPEDRFRPPHSFSRRTVSWVSRHLAPNDDGGIALADPRERRASPVSLRLEPFPVVSVVCPFRKNGPRILFESVLNQLSYHRKNATNGYSSVKRCEKPSDFVNFLREALVGIVKSLKENLGISKSSKKRERSIDGNMVYLIFDKLELARDWDKSSSILPLLFNLDSILNIPEVGLIFISSTPPDTFYLSMGYIEPIPIYFPTYSEDDLHQILVRNQANPKLYSSFLDVVLRPFCRITRRLDELSAIFSPLFVEYCKPLNDLAIVPNEDLKRKLFSNLQPHISLSLNETFRVLSQSSFGAERTKDREPRGSKRKVGTCEESDELDFHMSTSAKYLLISAFLASRNPATLDASLFDSRSGSDGRKRRRKHSETAKGQKEAEEEELLTRGPGSFPLERLLAIFQCITSGAEDTLGEEVQVEDSLEVEGQSGPLMSDVLLQLSSLCNANFIVKGGTCPLEGSTRYRSVVSEDLALKVAKSVKFPLAKYVYRR
ncbi:hypothetical protein NL676_011948 [Syzygium grande]|nr:hypothetical protein NL676_011948 [Syzygium grande]